MTDAGAKGIGCDWKPLMRCKRGIGKSRVTKGEEGEERREERREERLFYRRKIYSTNRLKQS